MAFRARQNPEFVPDEDDDYSQSVGAELSALYAAMEFQRDNPLADYTSQSFEQDEYSGYTNGAQGTAYSTSMFSLSPEEQTKTFQQDKDVYSDYYTKEGEISSQAEADASVVLQTEFSYWKLFKFASSLDVLLILTGTVSAVAHGLSGPVIVLLFGYMNNAYSLPSPNQAYHEALKYILLVFYIGGGTILASAIENVSWSQVGERQTMHIKRRYLESLLKQDIAFYDTEAKVGDVVTAVSSDILLIHDAVGEKIGAFISNLTIFLGGIAICLVTYWKMGLMGLTAIPLLLGSGFTFVAFYTKYVIRALTAYRSADLVAEQAISQVRTVYSFVGEAKALRSYSSLLEQAVKVASKTGLSKGLGLGTVIAVSYFSWALQLWFGGKLVEKDEIKGGTVNSLIFISIVAGKALGDCMQVFECIAKGKAAAERLFRVIERTPRINNSSDQGKRLTRVRGCIQFSNVCFSYPARPEVAVFTNLSLTIPEGKIVALVGSSGSGKSTVISLIQRFYDPDKGEVQLDGRDIRSLQPKWLRSQIGLVNQEPTLFATTIKKNILMGKPDASHEEVISAAKVAGAHTFICELPDAYNTEVGVKGIQLSGGQRQRIAIARAILRKPAIMLLDEATSALDSESEVLVQNALDRIMKARTTVVVAHRLSTIRDADIIVVFDKGRIIETGTHSKLLSLETGAYKSLVMTQESAGVSRRRTRSRQSSARQSPLKSPVRGPWAASPLSPWASPSRLSVESFTTDMPSIHEKTEDGPGVSKLQSSYSVTSWFRQRFSGVWSAAVVGTAGAVASGVLAAVFPMVMANVIVLLLDKNIKVAKKWTLGFLGLGGATLLSNFVQYFYCHRVGAHVSKEIQERSLEGVLKNEVGWFDFEENSSSAITSRLSANSTTLRNVLSDTYSYFLQNALGIFLALVLAIIYDYRMGLISLASLPIQVLGSAVSAGYSKDGFSGNVQKYHEDASRVAGEAVSSIRTVVSFGAQDSILSRFQQQLTEARNRRFKRSCVLGLFVGVSHGSLYISSAFCMWYGAHLIRQGEASFGPLIISFSIVAYTAYHCVELLGLIPDFKKGLAAIVSLFEISNRLSEIDPDSPNGTKLKKITGNLELKSVSFRYPSRPDVLILNRLSLKVPAGSTIALVGASGCGKSSVLSLVQRFYDPTSGSVMIDGRDIRSLHLRSLRKHIGFVQQEPVLFGVSIRENILYGREKASEAEMVDAAVKANAHGFISGLPDGYDTNVGEGGTQLSGGQKQRIAIARAILKNPTLLLLDEATSALDVESERIVQQAIDRLVSRERTTLLVAHRLSTVQSADMIAVMERGTVAEKGRHRTLLELGGAYSRLVTMQGLR